MRIFKIFVFITSIFLTFNLSAFSDNPTSASNSLALDTLWTVIAAVLVFFMQAGFAMVETGFTRAKNACNILMKNLMDFSIGSVAYWMFGFGIMFGAGNLLFGTSGRRLVPYHKAPMRDSLKQEELFEDETPLRR